MEKTMLDPDMMKRVQKKMWRLEEILEEMGDELIRLQMILRLPLQFSKPDDHASTGDTR
jgi:hypothetical protein